METCSKIRATMKIWKTRPGHRTGVLAVAVSLLTVGLVGVATAGDTELPAPTSTTPVTVTRTPNPIPLLLNTRVASHPNYERVVLDVSGPAPGYSVRYVSQLVYDGSGAPVPLTGGAFLSVVLHPAQAHTGDTGLNVYCCAKLFHPQLPNLTGVALTGDYEGYASVGLALRHRAGFRVLTLSNPTRIVVDIAH